MYYQPNSCTTPPAHRQAGGTILRQQEKVPPAYMQQVFLTNFWPVYNALFYLCVESFLMQQPDGSTCKPSPIASWVLKITYAEATWLSCWPDIFDILLGRILLVFFVDKASKTLLIFSSVNFGWLTSGHVKFFLSPTRSVWKCNNNKNWTSLNWICVNIRHYMWWPNNEFVIVKLNLDFLRFQWQSSKSCNW